MRRNRIFLLAVGTGLLFSPLILRATRDVPSPPTQFLFATLSATDPFLHATGRKGHQGWELDYKRDKPGYALKALADPLILEPGVYRFTFRLRRGHYPDKGFLWKAYPLFRLELWNLRRRERINWRQLQLSDFSSPNRYESRWLEFSVPENESWIVEPRIYWNGLANGEIAAIDISTFPLPSLKDLEDKAMRLGSRLETEFLENGFVVSRKKTGAPDETGDATTYTGFYAASLAWKYGATGDPLTYQALENALQTLHKAIKGPPDDPHLTRYVDANGIPFPKSPSKDVYTSFFFAYAVSYPFIQNEALKIQMRNDLVFLTDRFLQDGLRVKKGRETILSLTPHYTEAEIRRGVRTLFSEEESVRQVVRALKNANRTYPFNELWPNMPKLIEAVQQTNEEWLYNLTLPTLNGLADLLKRARDILRHQYRQENDLPREALNDLPGKQLERLLTRSLKKLPPTRKNNFGIDSRFDRISDFRVLAGNALISLHLVKTAAAVTEGPQFIDYYRSNLYSQGALLQCALDWYGTEEDFVRLTAGNPAADRMRKGYLSTLALVNLIRLETNPAIRESYQAILRRWWDTYRNEDNPFAAALVRVALDGKEGDLGLIRRGLGSYPEDQHGFGEAYWRKNGERVAKSMAGGVDEGYSREPVPISHRPRGSFLWQRNARRLRGDTDKDYPGTDYLFLYWFCRYHGLLPKTPIHPIVEKDRFSSPKK